MPVFRLSDRLVFPDPSLARHDGLLCVGGDLTPERLILAYQNGIFPWFSKEDPILWWSPDPRLVIFPGKLRVSRSLQKKIRKRVYTITMDRAFNRVINACADLRSGGSGHDGSGHGSGNDGTWLIPEMIEAYCDLHKRGYAHSVEAWKDGILVGGLYGIALGRCFFGESMFSTIDDSSKVALAALDHFLVEKKFNLIDCQVTSEHLVSMGGVEILRTNFLTLVHASLKKESIRDTWTFGGF
jgi:leucyl/phenylalanyl-tRNA--protein transferase